MARKIADMVVERVNYIENGLRVYVGIDAFYIYNSSIIHLLLFFINFSYDNEIHYG